jgi:hypothetical protein
MRVPTGGKGIHVAERSVGVLEYWIDGEMPPGFHHLIGERPSVDIAAPGP